MKFSARAVSLWLVLTTAAAMVAAEAMGHARARPTNSFAGSCSVKGTDTFAPPATNTARDLHLVFDATGTCSGELNGRSVENVPVSWHAADHSYGSCSQAKTVEPGHFAIRFPDGSIVRGSQQFTSMLTEVDMSLYGQRSGTAHAHATFATQRTSPSDISNCAGAGDRQVPMDLTMSTRSPLVSNVDRPPSPRRRLHLRVHPRAAAVGVRTQFVFRVTAGRGAPVAGTTIRFLGRSARTGANGVADIQALPHKPGRRVAAAFKPGYKVAKTRVKIRARG